MNAINGTTLVSTHAGAGRALFCLHGGMGIDSAYLHAPGILDLATSARQVILFDQRGHGHSGRSSARQYTHATWVADLDALASALAHERFALLGHSYGGFLALEYAIAHPHRVTHLILVGTSAGPVHRKPPPITTDAALRTFYHHHWAGFFPGDNAHWDVFQRISFSWKPFAAAFQRALPRYDLRTTIPQLGIPTLLIVGSHDPYRPDMEWLAQHLPYAHLTILPQSGHIPFLDHPAAFGAHISTFLETDTLKDTQDTGGMFPKHAWHTDNASRTDRNAL